MDDKMNIDIIIDAVTKAWGVKRSDLMRPTRGAQEISDARICLVYFLRRNGMTFAKIGNIIGRHHSTVINALKRFDDYIEYVPDFREKFIIANKMIEEAVVKNIKKIIYNSASIYDYANINDKIDFVTGRIGLNEYLIKTGILK